MRWAVVGVPALVLAGACIGGSAQADAVKPGRWEFTAQLQPSAAPPTAAAQLPPGTQPQSRGRMETTYTGCIGSDRPVPAELGPQCKLDRMERKSATVTWSMTCTNTQGSVRSDGFAQYRGDRMEATLVNHLPGANGAVSDLPQHITGRYLGPCLQSLDSPMTPSRPLAPPPAPSGSAADLVEPPAAAQGAVPSAAPAGNAATAAPLEPPSPRQMRYVRHRRHLYHRYYGGWFGGGMPYRGWGPAHESSGGP